MKMKSVYVKESDYLVKGQLPHPYWHARGLDDMTRRQYISFNWRTSNEGLLDRVREQTVARTVINSRASISATVQQVEFRK